MQNSTPPQNSQNLNITKAAEVVRSLRLYRPTTKKQLKNYIKAFLGLHIPDRRLCPDHNAPLDYLWHSFNADFAAKRSVNADLIVWANRGGGKTELAAIATLLDLIFKPGCQVRILAGSGEQAGLMYDYLTGFLQKGFDNLLAGPVRKD